MKNDLHPRDDMLYIFVHPQNMMGLCLPPDLIKKMEAVDGFEDLYTFPKEYKVYFSEYHWEQLLKSDRGARRILEKETSGL